jgi:hypothetical protein
MVDSSAFDSIQRRPWGLQVREVISISCWICFRSSSTPVPIFASSFGVAAPWAGHRTLLLPLHSLPQLDCSTLSSSVVYERPNAI